MANESQNVDAISAVFESPIAKGMLAALSAGAAVIKYIRDANERAARSATLAARYNLNGFAFGAIDRFPSGLHRAVAYGAALIAALEISILIGQRTLTDNVLKKLPGWLQFFGSFVSDHFIFMFFVSFVLYILFELRAIETLIANALGIFPGIRRSIEWANAKWQIEGSIEERRIIAPSQPGIDRVANKLIHELVSTARGSSLALRPTGVSDESAANILYFGHAVEQYCSEKLSRSFKWTVFYKSLGVIAAQSSAPFSATALNAMAPNSSIFSTLLLANAHLAEEDRIPNEPGLEEAVDISFQHLLNQLKGDARKLSSGFMGSDYARVLKRSRRFLHVLGMRRQFAKLFILWGVAPNATYPRIFRIPFNAGIFIQHIDDGVMRVEGDQFNGSSELTQICFEAVQCRVIERAFVLLEHTTDVERVTWREAERQDVVARRINWLWWVYYRIDVQTYHDSRSYKSENWKRVDNEVVKQKAA